MAIDKKQFESVSIFCQNEENKDENLIMHREYSEFADVSYEKAPSK